MCDSTDTNARPLAPTVTQLSYEAALERVLKLTDFERSTPSHSSFHLERMGLLMERLGNPHLDIPTVHIAGTKGKGSTAAMVTSMLAAEGYKVGLYTSPHLHSAVERIRVGRSNRPVLSKAEGLTTSLEPISKRGFASLVEQTWPAVERVGQEGGYGGVTFFEAVNAMSFLHFKQIGADFQVIEVGLGGRLDSTNIVRPQVCAITSISLDHVVTLGDTVEKIAYEKAGIIKRGVPVVVAPQPDEALAVFEGVASERKAPLVRVDERVSWRKWHADIEGQTFNVSGLLDSYNLYTRLLGDYQLENAATAITTVETLTDRGFAVSKDSIVRGISEVRWPARLEVLSRNRPIVVVDGAHNPYSMMRLVQAVREYFQFRQVILIFGALGGHSAKGMLAELVDLAPTVMAVRSRHPRSAPSGIISQGAWERGMPVVFQSENIGEATRHALEMAGEGDLVLGTGSLSVAAEVIEEVRGIQPEVYPYLKNPGAVTVA